MSQQPPWNQPQYRPGPPPGYPMAPYRPGQPGLATTIVVTLFFGLFGAIAAAVHSDRAHQVGLSGARYWKAFALTFAIAYIVIPLAMAALFWGTLVAVLTGGAAAQQPWSAQPYASQGPTDSSDWATPNQGSTSVPRATQSSAPTETSQPAAGQNPTLANGSWITVLDSLDKNDHTWSEAASRAATLSNSSYSVYAIDTDPVPGLNSGYYALAVIGRDSRTDATSVCSSFGRSIGGECYPRQIG